jgi:uncharacterized protein YprB with RNaseH-like and TPR domain
MEMELRDWYNRHVVLRNTFIHIPRIGYRTEERLWRSGFQSWSDYLDRCESCTVATLERDIMLGYLEQSARALDAGDARLFETGLPASECWRLYGDFRNRAAFLDIETTGLYPGANSITVIGLFDGHAAKAFVQGINLEDFADEIKKYDLIITFNGKRFDLPFIRSTFGDFPPRQGHLDLLYPLRKMGHRGGLKKVEVQFGIEREGSLRQVDGYLAVLLWREYRRGNRAALNTLIRYNLEDVVNLQYLADAVYNKSVAQLPIDLPRLAEPRRYALDIPFDEELVEYLRDRANEERASQGL